MNDEYLRGDETTEGSLRWELQQLESLIVGRTYKSMIDVMSTSLNVKLSMMEQDDTDINDKLKLSVQIDLLRAMISWAGSQMEIAE